MLIHETYENATENYIIGESGMVTPFTDDKAQLFRFLQREYGRCISKVYIDDNNNTARVVGWIFQKRTKYSDCNKTYLQQVWVTFHNSEPEHRVIYNYCFLDKDKKS